MISKTYDKVDKIYPFDVLKAEIRGNPDRVFISTHVFQLFRTQAHFKLHAFFFKWNIQNREYHLIYQPSLALEF